MSAAGLDHRLGQTHDGTPRRQRGQSRASTSTCTSPGASHPPPFAAKIAGIRTLADQAGRTIRFGVRLHTISRDRSEDAWKIADDVLAQLDPVEVAKTQAVLAASESEGQRLMRALHGGATASNARSLEVHPGLWSGIGLMGSGAGIRYA